MRDSSCQIVPSTQTKATEKNRALVVPVAKVAVFLKFVPNVKTKLDTPEVVTANVTRFPAVPPLALNVQAPVGVIVLTPEVVISTVMVPVVAEVAAAPVKPGPAGPVEPVAPVFPVGPVVPVLPVGPVGPAMP